MTPTKLKAALALGSAILAFAVAVASATAWFSKRFADVETRMQKLESAIKAINVDTLDEKHKELIKELLAEEQQASRTRVAAKAAPVHTFGKGVYPADAGSSANAPVAKPPN